MIRSLIILLIIILTIAISIPIAKAIIDLWESLKK